MPRRVLLASASYYPIQGGVENSLFNLSAAYRELGFRPWVVTSDAGASLNRGRAYEITRTRGIPVLRYKNSRFVLMRLIRVWCALRLLYRAFSFDLLVARDYLPVLANRNHTRCIYLVPGLVANERSKRFASWAHRLDYVLSVALQKKALTTASCLAVFSKRMADQIRDSGINRVVRFVKPGIDVRRFTPVSREEAIRRRIQLGIPPNAHVIIVLGRLSQVKRVDLAIQALNGSPEDWYLLVVGDGPERNTLEMLALSEGLSHRVRFVGATDAPEYYLAMADVLALPSEVETFGQVLLEAVACGLKVVAFDPDLVGIDTATREVVPPPLLYLAERKDPRAFQTALAAALCEKDNPRTTLSAGAITAAFSWETLANRLVEFADAEERDND